MGRIIRLGGRKKPPKVNVCIPYYRGLPHALVMLDEQLIYHGIPGYDIRITKQQTTIIQFARNDLAFTKQNKDCDFIFFIDDDIGFSQTVMGATSPTGMPVMISHMKKILDHNLNICGGFYCTRKPPYLPNVFRNLEGTIYTVILDPPDHGVHEVAAIGTGFLCIKRQVFEEFTRRREAILKTYREGLKALEALSEKVADRKLRKLVDKIQAMVDVSQVDVYPPFWLKYIYDRFKKEWAYMGEDIFFSHHARQMGYKIYCDFSVELGHETTHYVEPEHYRQNYQKECIEAHKQETRKLGAPCMIGEPLDTLEK